MKKYFLKDTGEEVTLGDIITYEESSPFSEEYTTFTLTKNILNSLKRRGVIIEKEVEDTPKEKFTTKTFNKEVDKVLNSIKKKLEETNKDLYRKPKEEKNDIFDNYKVNIVDTMLDNLMAMKTNIDSLINCVNLLIDEQKDKKCN